MRNNKGQTGRSVSERLQNMTMKLFERFFLLFSLTENILFDFNHMSSVRRVEKKYRPSERESNFMSLEKTREKISRFEVVKIGLTG